MKRINHKILLVTILSLLLIMSSILFLVSCDKKPIDKKDNNSVITKKEDNKNNNKDSKTENNTNENNHQEELKKIDDRVKKITNKIEESINIDQFLYTEGSFSLFNKKIKEIEGKFAAEDKFTSEILDKYESNLNETFKLLEKVAEPQIALQNLFDNVEVKVANNEFAGYSAIVRRYVDVDGKIINESEVIDNLLLVAFKRFTFNKTLGYGILNIASKGREFYVDDDAINIGQVIFSGYTSASKTNGYTGVTNVNEFSDSSEDIYISSSFKKSKDNENIWESTESGILNIFRARFDVKREDAFKLSKIQIMFDDNAIAKLVMYTEIDGKEVKLMDVLVENLKVELNQSSVEYKLNQLYLQSKDSYDVKNFNESKIFDEIVQMTVDNNKNTNQKLWFEVKYPKDVRKYNNLETNAETEIKLIEYFGYKGVLTSDNGNNSFSIISLLDDSNYYHFVKKDNKYELGDKFNDDYKYYNIAEYLVKNKQDFQLYKNTGEYFKKIENVVEAKNIFYSLGLNIDYTKIKKNDKAELSLSVIDETLFIKAWYDSKMLAELKLVGVYKGSNSAYYEFIKNDALDKVIAFENTYKESDYSAESYKELKECIKNAKDMKKDEYCSYALKIGSVEKGSVINYNNALAAIKKLQKNG